MASAVAMNRRRSRAGGMDESSKPLEFIEEGSDLQQKHKNVKGTPVQQCWHVLNFHEERLNRIGGHLQSTSQQHVEELKLQESQGSMIDVLKQQVQHLESELLDIKGQLAKNSKSKKGTNAVQLEVNNN